MSDTHISKCNGLVALCLSEKIGRYFCIANIETLQFSGILLAPPQELLQFLYFSSV